jgi:hypothetical protein
VNCGGRLTLIGLFPTLKGCQSGLSFSYYANGGLMMFYYILTASILIAALLAYLITHLRAKRVLRKFRNYLEQTDERYNDCGVNCECSEEPFNTDATPNSPCRDENKTDSPVNAFYCRRLKKILAEESDECYECGNKAQPDCGELACQQNFVDSAADPKTGFFYSGFTYDPYADIFYSTKDAFQRRFGYCKFYDTASPICGMALDSEPVKFKYAGKNWMIEFWKGQYGVATGAEIGIYVKDGKGKGGLYDSATDCQMLDMRFILCKNRRKIMHRKGRSWWLTGFKLGTHSKCKELIMYAEIVFKDKEMKDAFVTALKKKGYKTGEYCEDKDAVYIEYNRPKTCQPFTKFLLSGCVYRYTKKFCAVYQNLTEDTDGTTLQKLACLKDKDIKLAKKLSDMGKYNFCGKGDIFEKLSACGSFCEDYGSVGNDERDDADADELIINNE